MSNLPPPIPSSPLQFDRVEPIARQQVATCVGCGRGVEGTYFTIGGQMLCPTCRASLSAPPANSTRRGRLLKATLFGIGAGIAGAIIWDLIGRFTGYQIGLVALLVGWLVGKAVRIGGGGRGGRGYQVLAVIITYVAICLSSAPEAYHFIVNQSREQQSSNVNPADVAKTDVEQLHGKQTAIERPAVPVQNQTPLTKPQMFIAWVTLGALIVAICLVSPFLAGASGLIGLLIIGFALFQAWQLNRSLDHAVQGPFTMGDAPPVQGG